MDAEDHIRRAESLADGAAKHKHSMAGAATMLLEANFHATLAVAKMLAEVPVCDHGNRGWCLHCFKLEVSIPLGG